MVSAVVTGHGSAVPGVMPQAALWDEFFSDHYGGSDLARRIWSKAGVDTRHGVVDPRTQDISQWGTGERMRRFVAEAMPLGKEALAACMDDAGLSAGDVDALTVVSCTGYATPGLDILLARDMGMPVDVQRVHIGHMGCYAAIPALATVSDAAAARGQAGLMLCLELTSLHIQPATPDPEQMVAHALFSDAAAAVAVVPDATQGLEVVDFIARTDAARSALMTWDVTDLGFRMGLSPQVPDVLADHVVDVVDELLSRNAVKRNDVGGWAVHPGGPRIVDVVAERLGLTADDVEDARETLRTHGNCSSATVLLILNRMLAGGAVDSGQYVVAMAFGPGLTLYASLLRRR